MIPVTREAIMAQDKGTSQLHQITEELFSRDDTTVLDIEYLRKPIKEDDRYLLNERGEIYVFSVIPIEDYTIQNGDFNYKEGVKKLNAWFDVLSSNDRWNTRYPFELVGPRLACGGMSFDEVIGNIKVTHSSCDPNFQIDDGERELSFPLKRAVYVYAYPNARYAVSDIFQFPTESRTSLKKKWDLRKRRPHTDLRGMHSSPSHVRYVPVEYNLEEIALK